MRNLQIFSGGRIYFESLVGRDQQHLACFTVYPSDHNKHKIDDVVIIDAITKSKLKKEEITSTILLDVCVIIRDNNMEPNSPIISLLV